MRARALLGSAIVSLVAGCAVYLLARPEPPALFNLWMALLPAIAHEEAALAIPFAYQLPSFFHMFAMLLAALAVTMHNRPMRYVALSITAFAGLAMEFVQHPAVIDTVLACGSRRPCDWLQYNWISALKDYAEHGTFDSLDVLAIIFAIALIGILATIHDVRLQHSNKKELAT